MLRDRSASSFFAYDAGLVIRGFATTDAVPGSVMMRLSPAQVSMFQNKAAAKKWVSDGD